MKRLECLSGEIDALDVLHVNSHIKRGEYVSEHLHFNVTYILIGDETEKTRVKPDENSAVAWISVADLDKFVSEEKMLVVYRKLIERCKRIQMNYNRAHYQIMGFLFMVSPGYFWL